MLGLQLHFGVELTKAEIFVLILMELESGMLRILEVRILKELHVLLRRRE